MQVRPGLVLQDLVFQTITPATDFYNMPVMKESVDNDSGHCLRAEDRVPETQRVVAGQDDAGSLVAVGDDCEEHLCLFLSQCLVTDFVNHNQTWKPHGSEQLLGLSCLKCRVDLGNQVAHRDVVDLPAFVDCNLCNGDRQMALSCARVSDEYDVFGLVHEPKRSEVPDLGLVDGRLEREVEVLQVLDYGNLRALLKHLHASGFLVQNHKIQIGIQELEFFLSCLTYP